MLFIPVMSLLVLTCFTFVPPVAHGDDVQDLHAVLEQQTNAINTRDLDALAAVWHEHVVQFGPASPFPIDGKAALQRAFQGLFAAQEHATLTVLKPRFRIIGTTGLVWGHAALTAKPKDGPLQTTFARITFTYVKEGEKWLVVQVHASPLQVGD